MGSIAMEEYDLLGDSKYRKYALLLYFSFITCMTTFCSYMTQVDRALKGFESTSEWADLIAALTKLNRVLLSHMKYPIIPRRLLISKRLAQCMHPDLPSGVHQKALETYDIIFKCMGTNRLAAELFIYSAGLFPLLPHSALNVRSALLTLYETHFVPLGSRLTPGLNGFLSGVLPSLEEGSEHYSRTNNLLEAVVEGVGANVFYSSLWECVATNSSVRLPALTFVLSHLSRGNGRPSHGVAEHILGGDIQVICTALCMSLTDSSVLVQRSALDLLLHGFPLHYQQFEQSDMVIMVSSVLVTLLRRDMSLNRRLFNWLLGSEIHPSLLPDCHPVGGSKKTDEGYFSTYSFKLLIQALLRLLKLSIPSSSGSQLDVKPFRIITTLLDKADIGPVIIESVMVDIFRCLFHIISSNPGHKQELIKTANLLFAQLDTSYVWTVCGQHFSNACDDNNQDDVDEGDEVGAVGSGPSSVIQCCNVIVFLLDTVSIETYIETSSEHLPSLFKLMVTKLTEHIEKIKAHVLSVCISTLRKILARVQPAWNIWDVSEKLKRSKSETATVTVSENTEVAKEATESSPGSPVYIPLPENNENSKQENNQSISKQSEDEAFSPNVHEILVSECKTLFLKFFSEIVKTRIIQSPETLWKNMIFNSNDSVTSDNDGLLEELLLKVLQIEESNVNVQNSKCSDTDNIVQLNKDSSEFGEAFGLACNCILELSSMPKYCNGDNNQNPGAQSSVSTFPNWLSAIILSCVASDHDEVSPVQLSAITTLIELSTLVRAFSDTTAGDGKKTTGGSSVLVSMDPVMTQSQLQLMMKNSEVIVKIASILWSNIEQQDVSVKCVALLHRLINIAKVGEVETVLASSLTRTTHSPAQYQRFASLWHLSRDLVSSGNSKSAMDLCTIKMIFGLRSSRGSVRAVCARWAEQCVARGDVARLVEPLLLSLLDPTTARVSVLHIKMNKAEEDKKQINPNHVAKFSSNVFATDDETEKFPYSNSKTWVNPFALVSSESLYNQDPTVTPEPKEASTSESRTSTASSSPSTPRKIRSESIVASLLSDLVSMAVDRSNFILDITQFNFPSLSPRDRSDSEPEVNIHPLHSHLLFYTGAVDTRAAIWTLQCLQDLLSVHSRSFVASLATTSMSSQSLPRSAKLIHLLSRHRQSIYGKGFTSTSTLSSETSASLRSAMMLESILSVCLFYLRSYFSNITEISPEDISGNRELRLIAVTTLNKILTELVMIVKDSGKSFSLYILDLLVRCKLQKVTLHCLLTSVYQLSNVDKPDSSFTQKILQLNDDTEAEESARNKDLEAFQVELLKLVMTIVMLEEVINNKKNEDGKQTRNSSNIHSSSLLKYYSDLPFCCQPMFLAAVMSALKHSQMRSCHRQWTSLVVACLPVLGPALTQLVTAVAGQLCDNLELMTRGETRVQVTTDYVLSQLECLGQIISYCLLDSSSSGQVSMGPSTPISHHQPSMMSNLVHVLGGNSSSSRNADNSEHVASASRALLSTCPRLLKSLACVWSSLNNQSEVKWLIGSGKIIKSSILELVSPLATVHSTYFLAALSVAWAEIDDVDVSTSVSVATLVELVSSVKTFPLATVIGTLRQVVKSPPSVSGLSKSVAGTSTIQTASLQFFSTYLSSCLVTNLYESWQELKELLKDCCSLPAPAPFLALTILHQFVTRGATGNMERRELKEVQEMTTKLVETISLIGGTKLEAGTWLRGGRSVKVDPNPGQQDTSTCQASAALVVLSKLLATLLDIVYQSDEKEKAMPLLTTVMYNLVPYLRVHSKANLHLLRAGSGLLASLSEYPFTRRAWRREGMELLLDPAFFKLDHETLKYWRTTTDNLMSHDRTTFKELLTKIANLGQSTGIR